MKLHLERPDTPDYRPDNKLAFSKGVVTFLGGVMLGVMMTTLAMGKGNAR
jgi:hypothetical protein